LVPQHDADSMRIRRFALSWRGNLSFNRVEQIPLIIRGKQSSVYATLLFQMKSDLTW